LSQFSATQHAGGVITFSSGNHAQAIALAARMLKMKAVIIMPSDAPRVKIEATRGYGAEVILYDRNLDDREAMGHELAKQRGLTLISPYDHPHVIAGQGTVAIELSDDVSHIDILITPIGGGGLLSGCAIAAKKINPSCHVVGVEPETGNDAQQSFYSGHIVSIDPPNTIADGAQTQHLGEHTFPIIRKLVDEIVTVHDRDLVETMMFLASRMKIIVEPTGCLAAAAVLSKTLNVAGKKVGIVLSGGNIDMLRFASLLQEFTSPTHAPV